MSGTRRRRHDAAGTPRPVYVHEIGQLVERFRGEIAALGAREPSHAASIEEAAFMLLGGAICGQKAGPLLGAALLMRDKVANAAGAS